VIGVTESAARPTAQSLPVDSSETVDACSREAEFQLDIDGLDLAGGQCALDVAAYEADWSYDYDHH
jgi:hypothetical protein